MAIILEYVRDRYPHLVGLFNFVFGAIMCEFFFTLLSRMMFNLYTPFYVLGGILMADYVGGSLHMLIDKFKLAEDHHVRPWRISVQPFFIQFGESLLFNLFIWKICPQTQLWIWGCLISILIEANHLYHHKKKVPEIIKFLWKHNILLSKERHKVHHIEALQGRGVNYCILTGFTEPLVVLTEKGLDFINGLVCRINK